ncbi:NAD(P)/FAD-dependent oxidoreductase [Burkholderia sp. Ac-20353]|uniref:NAD(P)/FAD-dependent oxidoreductase n=1 Tax=Burkholderia sp. Ac-20353 TaxID=2703894 RepID=UPI00197BC039|nr:NAD(P)/FAD-dependent oxidoreductase [Burkholderia sp. Ac-20353]MBN3787680.1 FAD-dependent oxidoreductase [Burkholderia sp. Ac-20353]
MNIDDGGVKSRRHFLKGAGVAMAATAIAPLTASATEKKHSTSPTGAREFDVIVIGGGFAGLTAARDCSQKGMKTLLLEARTRIGGRTFTSQYRDHHVELGGTWVHWAQPHVWAEITRYGLTLAETPGASPTDFAWRSEGAIKRADGQKAFAMLTDAMVKYCDVDGQLGRSVYPRAPEPLLRADIVAKYDRMSLNDRLGQMKFTPEIRDLLAPQYTINAHRDPSTSSFAEQLHWWARGDFDIGLLFDRCGHYKIEQGTAGLANAIRQDGDFQMLTGTPVKSVMQGRGKALVGTDQGTFSAGAVICAAPINTLKDIRFEPGLNAAKMAASKLGVTGKGRKCYIHVKQKLGVWMGCAPYPYPITLAFTEQERDDGTLIACFDSSGTLDVNDEQAVQSALRGLIPGAEVVSVISYPWTDDPFSQGTWAFYHPGQLTGSLTALRANEGNFFFASSDSAMLWRGFIDGAIESGIHTATQVFNKLNTKAHV